MAFASNGSFTLAQNIPLRCPALSRYPAERIVAQAISTGIEKFCSRRSVEIVSDKTLHDLRKVQEVDFTIPHLASNVFREKHTNTRNRIHKWCKEGIIIDLDRVENPNPQQTRPVKLMAVTDIRVAKVMNQHLTIPEFLRAKYKRCPGCGNTVLRDWGTRHTVTRCETCQLDLLDDDLDTSETWRHKELARQSRRRVRRELLQYSQMPMPLFTDGELQQQDDDDDDDDGD